MSEMRASEAIQSNEEMEKIRELTDILASDKVEVGEKRLRDVLREKGIRQIEVHSERCSGCQSCQLACSFAYTRSFNLVKSRIIINWPGDLERKITFAEDCTNCGICVPYCNFAAIEFKKE